MGFAHTPRDDYAIYVAPFDTTRLFAGSPPHQQQWERTIHELNLRPDIPDYDLGRIPRTRPRRRDRGVPGRAGARPRGHPEGAQPAPGWTVQGHVTRNEKDRAEILSGVFEGVTTGAPISLITHNADQRSKNYDNLKDVFRPGHADYTYWAKYGHRDHRGGGRSSSRETWGRVAAGAIAKKVLADGWCRYVRVHPGNRRHRNGDVRSRRDRAEPRALSGPRAAEQMVAIMSRSRRTETASVAWSRFVPPACRLALVIRPSTNLTPSSVMAMLSIPATKGVEIGAGFAIARDRGSEANDAFEIRRWPDPGPLQQCGRHARRDFDRRGYRGPRGDQADVIDLSGAATRWTSTAYHRSSWSKAGTIPRWCPAPYRWSSRCWRLCSSTSC